MGGAEVLGRALLAGSGPCLAGQARSPARPGLRSGQVSGQAQLAAGARPTVDVSEVRVLTGMRPRGPAMTPRPAGPSLMRVYCSPSNAGGSKGSAKTGQPWALGPAGGLHVETDQG